MTYTDDDVAFLAGQHYQTAVDWTNYAIRLGRRDLMELPPEHPEVAAWDGRVLILSGDTGVGKTTQATQLAWKYVIRPGVLIPMPWTMAFRAKQLLVEIATTRKKADDLGNEDPFRQVKRCGFLILDDLGVENLTEAQQSYLDEIIDARSIDFRSQSVWSIFPEDLTPRTVITTNLDQGAFKATYGDRIWSRVTGSDCDWIEITGRDRRKDS
jgi:DNA replication protein DnaC